jgi:HAD superfamily hydrolase (TIGR01662 family)
METISSKPQAIFFDLGNTLTYYSSSWPNSFYQFADPVHLFLERNHIHLPEQEFKEGLLHKIVIHEPQAADNYREEKASDVFAGMLASFGYPDLDAEFIHRCLRVMYGIAENFWTPEEDALPVLKELSDRGYKLGVISNANDDEDAQNIIDKGGFRPYLDLAMSSCGFGYGKPGKAIFEYALEQLNATAGQAWMVGDTLRSDILGANRMGMESIWITRRAVNVDKPITDPEMQPRRSITALQELLDLL